MGLTPARSPPAFSCPSSTTLITTTPPLPQRAAHKLDIAGDAERAAGLKKFLNGPTATGGRLTLPDAHAAFTQRAQHTQQLQGQPGSPSAAAAVAVA